MSWKRILSLALYVVIFFAFVAASTGWVMMAHRHGVDDGTMVVLTITLGVVWPLFAIPKIFEPLLRWGKK